MVAENNEYGLLPMSVFIILSFYYCPVGWLFFSEQYILKQPHCPDLRCRLPPQRYWRYFRISLEKIIASGLEFQVNIYSPSVMLTAGVKALKYISASPRVARSLVWIIQLVIESCCKAEHYCSFRVGSCNGCSILLREKTYRHGLHDGIHS